MTTIRRWYLFSTTSVLCLTSIAKLYSATGSAKILDLTEALLPLTNRQTLLLLGAIELVIALALVLGRNDAVKLICIIWLSSNFVLYRVASFLLVVGRPCPCLGSITERLPFKPAVIDRLLVCLVVYMLLGSCFFLVTFWRGRQRGNPQQSGFPAVADQSIP